MSEVAITGSPGETSSVALDDARIRARHGSTQHRLGISALALCSTLAILLAIFWFVLSRGLPAFKPTLFTTVTSGISGGLENAILGTLMLVIFAVIIVSIIGFGTGIWLSSYASEKPRALVRLLTDVLAGVPSVVVGYFGYILLVKIAGWQVFARRRRDRAHDHHAAVRRAWYRFGARIRSARACAKVDSRSAQLTQPC